MLVEGSGEVTLQQLVVVDGLSNDVSHKLEIAEVVGVAVGGGVDGVGDTLTLRGLKQHIVGIEDLTGDNEVPLPQQPTGVLAFFSCIHTIHRYSTMHNTDVPMDIWTQTKQQQQKPHKADILTYLYIHSVYRNIRIHNWMNQTTPQYHIIQGTQ